MNTRLTEKELVKGLIGQDLKTLGILHSMYLRNITGVIRRIVINEELAEDLAQECFVKIWTNGPGYEASKGRLFTWMLNIARNLAIDQLRSKSFKNSSRNIDLSSSFSELEEMYFTDDLKYETIGIRQLIEQLDTKLKAVIQLYYFNGYTQQQTAEELQLPLGTVKTRLKTAISHLQKLVANDLLLSKDCVAKVAYNSSIRNLIN